MQTRNQFILKLAIVFIHQLSHIQYKRTKICLETYCQWISTLESSIFIVNKELLHSLIGGIKGHVCDLRRYIMSKSKHNLYVVGLQCFLSWPFLLLNVNLKMIDFWDWYGLCQKKIINYTNRSRMQKCLRREHNLNSWFI